MSIQTIAEMAQERPRTAWEAALLLPDQGNWGEEEYLWLAAHTNRLVELSDGSIEVLPMPTPKHQKIVLFLYRVLFSFVSARSLGTLLVAPLSVRLWPGQFREPDLALMLAEHAGREEDDCWDGADLVVEVVSPSKPDHDLIRKRKEYAEAGIPEYWIVDPQTETITVLRFDGTSYAEHGVFKRGETATSALLDGFSVSVDAALEAK